VVRVEWAVLKEGFEDIVERFEPGVGEGIRGVWYCDALGERSEDCWLARVGVVGDANGFVGLEVLVGEMEKVGRNVLCDIQRATS
jgi:hypothetical protein